MALSLAQEINMKQSYLSITEYHTIVQQAPIMIWRSDTTGECDYFNERWLEFTGRGIEKELGNGWAEGVHHDDLERCLCIYRDSFRERVPFEMEYRLMRNDGVYRWIFDRGAPFYSPEGTFQGYIGSCIDVTDRVEAQEAIKKYHESEIEALRDILPICAYCKNIRDDEGFWRSVEQYFSTHSKKDFSHGICPACYEKVKAEIRG